MKFKLCLLLKICIRILKSLKSLAGKIFNVKSTVECRFAKASSYPFVLVRLYVSVSEWVWMFPYNILCACVYVCACETEQDVKLCLCANVEYVLSFCIYSVCVGVCPCLCACQGCAPQRFGSGLTFPALTSCLSSSPLPVDGRKPWRDTLAPATQTCLFVSTSEEVSSTLVTDTHTHKCTRT